MIIDLTQTLENGISIYPGTEDPVFEQLSTVKSDGSAVIKMNISTHSGTHVDSPAHFVDQAKTLDQFTIEELHGNGLVINCLNEYSITLDLLKPYKDKISNASFILFYAGWDKKWKSTEYLNPFPTLTLEAIDWLIQFPIKGLGFDSISADSIDSVDFPNHQAILGNGIIIIENLCHLDQLLEKNFEFYTIPLKIKESDGSPIRAFAVLKD